MALIAVDGLDFYNTTTNMLQKLGPLQWFNVPGSLSSPGRGGFGKCLSTSGGTLIAGLSSPVSKLTCGFGLNFGGYNSATNPLIVRFVDQLTQDVQCYFEINPGNGLIQFYNAAGVLVASGLNSISSQGWFFIELQATISTSAGTAAVRVNGQPVASFPDQTGLNTQASANASVSSVNWYMVSQYGALFEIDDLYFADGTTGPGSYPCNSFVGSTRVSTQFAVGNGSVSWSPSDSGTDNWNMVAETAFDGDTTYNRTNTAGAQDLLNFQALASTISQVIAVQATGAYRKEDAGSRTLANVLKSGSTTSVGATRSPDVSYLFFTDLFALDPNTSASWAVSAVNALQAGYKVVT